MTQSTRDGTDIAATAAMSLAMENIDRSDAGAAGATTAEIAATSEAAAAALSGNWKRSESRACQSHFVDTIRYLPSAFAARQLYEMEKYVLNDSTSNDVSPEVAFFLRITPRFEDTDFPFLTEDRHVPHEGLELNDLTSAIEKNYPSDFLLMSASMFPVSYAFERKQLQQTWSADQLVRGILGIIENTRGELELAHDEYDIAEETALDAADAVAAAAAAGGGAEGGDWSTDDYSSAAADNFELLDDEDNLLLEEDDTQGLSFELDELDGYDSILGNDEIHLIDLEKMDPQGLEQALESLELEHMDHISITFNNAQGLEVDEDGDEYGVSTMEISASHAMGAPATWAEGAGQGGSLSNAVADGFRAEMMTLGYNPAIIVNDDGKSDAMNLPLHLDGMEMPPVAAAAAATATDTHIASPHDLSSGLVFSDAFFQLTTAEQLQPLFPSTESIGHMDMWGADDDEDEYFYNDDDYDVDVVDEDNDDDTGVPRPA